jgi:hypothetical protein
MCRFGTKCAHNFTITPGLFTQLAPSDNCLFPNLKVHVKGGMYLSIEKTTSNADGWIGGQKKRISLLLVKKFRPTNARMSGAQGERVYYFSIQ